MAQTNQRAAVAPRLEIIQTIANQILNSKWAIWLASPRADGKTGKIPHTMCGNQLITIGHDNPTQWVDFNTALKWFQDSKGRVSGLGLLVGSNSKAEQGLRYSSNITALDIDCCLDDKGELLSTLSGDVRQVIKLIQSTGIYLEISPSGKGLRAIWFGNKPLNIGERWKSFETSGELYDGSSTRFVTVTGQAWQGSPVSIINVSHEFVSDIVEYLGLNAEAKNITQILPNRNLSPITDAEIIAKVKMMSQGKGKRLFEGDASDYADDLSAADLALCAYIAKWTDDLAQVVRVWGLSALGKREKFLTRSGYREQTARKAIDGVRASTSTRTQAETQTKARVESALTQGDTSGLLAEYIVSVGGKIPKTFGAAEKIISLDSRLSGAFAYDNFSSQVLKLRSIHSCIGDVVPRDKEPNAGQCWSDADTANITIWLESQWGLALKIGQVHDAVDVAARRFSINTVVDALEALKWDARPRLESWLIKYLHADSTYDTPRYLSAIGKAWMIGTVARAYQPGCKHDHVLTLEGGQGYGKSKALRTLASAIAPQAYREGLPPLTLGQEATRSLNGAWVIELPELAFMDKTTTECVKAFITKESDSFRLPYGRREVTVPRTVSFAATTNQGEFVRDTAARRFWVFKITKPIDIKELDSVAKQLWAEAVVAYKAGESWWLTDATVLKDAEASQSGRLERSGFDELIAERIIDKITVQDIETFREQALHLWDRCTNNEGNLEFHKNARAFSDALIRCGFIRSKSQGKSFWHIGPDLASRIRKASQLTF